MGRSEVSIFVKVYLHIVQWAVLYHPLNFFLFFSSSYRRPPGSNPVIFTAPSKPQTNATDLTKGDYQFRVVVTDENSNNASGSVFVTVTQSMWSCAKICLVLSFLVAISLCQYWFFLDQNAPPKANGGGDQTIILPVSVIVLNGSQSSDDLGIVSWKWTREPDSLAIGRILGTSDTSSSLLVRSR